VFGRDAARQLDQFVVEEGHARLQAPGHRHVVDPLDGIEIDRPHDMGREITL
jgi:hypothetical protein